MRLSLTSAWAAAALLVAVLVTPSARAESPIGRWLTQDGGGVIEILPCGKAVCGRIVGMREPLLADGSPRKDRNGRSQCGLTILHDARETEPGVWSGRITNPEDGTDWNCQFRVDTNGTLRLRGYVVVPLLGQTQAWTRYAGSADEACRLG